MTRRWVPSGPWEQQPGIWRQIEPGRLTDRGDGRDLRLTINTRGRWVVPTTGFIGFLGDFIWDNERHNRPAPAQGGRYIETFMHIAMTQGIAAAVQWDEDNRGGR